jgi:hypothetical protein
MNLAVDTSSAAIVFRAKGDDLAQLQRLVEKWSRRLFCPQDADRQASILSEILSGSDAFQLNLANAIDWGRPKSDSAAAIQTVLERYLFNWGRFILARCSLPTYPNPVRTSGGKRHV